MTPGDPATKTLATLAQVAVDGPFPHPLTYLLPPALAADARPGCLVVVPLQQRKVTGILWRIDRDADPSSFGGKLKAVEAVAQGGPLVEERLLRLLNWVSGYYQAPPGEVCKAPAPSAFVGQLQTIVQAMDTADGTAASPAQAKLLSALHKAGGFLPLGQAALMAEVTPATVRSWAGKGLVALKHWLQPPKVTPLMRQVATLAISGRDVAQVIDSLPLHAVRKRAVLAALAQHGDTDVAALDEGSRPAVKSLEREGLVRIEQRRVLRAPLELDFNRTQPPTVTSLSPDQQQALDALCAALDSRAFTPFLLHGVTGSGKTEVYIRAALHARQHGGQSLIMAPEIALTPQLIRRFCRHFGDRVAVWHSALSQGERLDQYHRIRAGEVDVVIGARSAVLMPLSRLALVVVDEEHEGAYKADTSPRYHGRDVAVYRARECGATVVLGSATPSLESWHNARSGRYQLLRLPSRIGEKPLPPVRLVKLTPRDIKDNYFISPELVVALDQTFRRGEQAIIFVPRRGFAPVLACAACGESLQCPHCQVSLAHHQHDSRMHCHYCGYSEPTPLQCPSCQSTDIALLGLGTERIVEVLHNFFPRAKLDRLDRDRVRARGSLAEVLEQFSRGQVDALVGTQMVTKGHDFPNVTLVGVILADHTVNFPDFRAAEKSFCLLTQVAGRAGRGERAGQVILQTLSPRHPLFGWVMDHDYEGFAKAELAWRRKAIYPPFVRLARVLFSGPEESAVMAWAQTCADTVRLLPGREPSCRGLVITGPAAAPLARLKDLHRSHLILKAPTVAALVKAVDACRRLGQEHPPAGGLLTVDIDPYNML